MPNLTRTIMPEVYCAADAGWIQDMLIQLSPAARGKIAVKYAQVYQATWDSEVIEYKQENRARHEANSRLRECVKTYAAANAGLTTKPKQFVA